VIVSLDADLQNDPADIPRLIAALESGFDVVSGWRKDRKDPFVSRVLISRIANWIIGFLSRVRIHDYGCSLKAYRASVVKDVRLYGEMHRFIPIYAKWQGARIAELEVTHHPRRHGKSKYGIDRVFKVTMDLLVVLFLHKYNQKPMYIFGAAGMFSFVVAFLAGSLAVFYKVTGQKSFIETPLPLLVALGILVGFMCFLMGLLAEMIVRTYFEAQEKKTYSVERISGVTS
jgi:glycosyltransferase involved in cell wall biosynthesis